MTRIIEALTKPLVYTVSVDGGLVEVVSLADYEAAVDVLSTPRVIEGEPVATRKGDDFLAEGANHYTYGISVQKPDGSWWGNQIEIYGNEELRDTILAALTASPSAALREKEAAWEETRTAIAHMRNENDALKAALVPFKQIADDLKSYDIDDLDQARVPVGLLLHARAVLNKEIDNAG